MKIASIAAESLFKKSKAYKKVFDTEEGKIVLKDLLEVCKVDKAPDSDNTNIVMERNGMRKVGLYLINMANHTDETLKRFADNNNIK